MENMKPEDKCPCEWCVVKAICSGRLIEELISHCPMVQKYTEFIYRNYPTGTYFTNGEYYESDNYNIDRLYEVCRVLKPHRWGTGSMYSGR